MAVFKATQALLPLLLALPCSGFPLRPYIAGPRGSGMVRMMTPVTADAPATMSKVEVLPRALELFGDKPPSPTGTDYLPEEAKERAKKGSFVEKIKLKQDCTAMWTEVHELAAMLRSGQYKWEDLELDTIDQRLKYAGLFHRRKRTPGRFMMRMKIPNGIVTSDQLNFCAEALAKYGEKDEACVIDITTRQNLQLRGLKLEDTSELITGLVERGLGCYMSGLDNVRNVVGNPMAGIDPLEDYDTRQLCEDINNMLTNNNRGNPEFGNLPRKFNIAVSGSRDDYAHTHINDIGLQAIEKGGVMGFNVVLGGYFSTKRAATSVHMDLWVPADQAVNLCYSILLIFRDHGERKDRQKARLLWLIESWGLEKFRDEVLKVMRENPKYGGFGSNEAMNIGRHVEQKATAFERRDYLGIHEQKQPGLYWVGVHVPVGRFTAFEVFELARVAEKFSGGELRLTVEQNVIFPNVKEADLQALLDDPFMAGRFKINPGPLARGVVSCTGAQFCGIGLVETKMRAVRMVEILESKFDVPQTVRMHWSGCPNSCGQSQVADIGLMGAPAKKDGKAVEGVDIFLGGAVGEEAELGEKHLTNVAMGNEDEDVIEALGKILVEKFNAKPKVSA